MLDLFSRIHLLYAFLLCFHIFILAFVQPQWGFARRWVPTHLQTQKLWRHFVLLGELTCNHGTFRQGLAGPNFIQIIEMVWQPGLVTITPEKKHRWLFLSQPIPSPIEVKMSEKESFWGDAISFEVKIHDFIKCLPWQVDWGYTWASRHKSIAIHTHPQGQSPSRERWHTWNTWAPHGELIWVDHCVWVHLSR